MAGALRGPRVNSHADEEESRGLQETGIADTAGSRRQDSWRFVWCVSARPSVIHYPNGTRASQGHRENRHYGQPRSSSRQDSR